MKYVKFTAGFILGVLFVYIIGALVGWDYNPGGWNDGWRFICIMFALFWGFIFGLIAKERKKKPKIVIVDNVIS